MTTPYSELIINWLWLMSQFNGAKRLPVVIIYHIEPYALYASPRGRLLPWIWLHPYCKIYLPDVYLIHEIDSHHPTLVTILKLLKLYHAHTFTYRWLYSGAIVLQPWVLLEHLTKITILATEPKSRFLDRLLSSGLRLQIPCHFEVIWLLFRWIWGEVSLKYPEICKISNNE